MVALDLLRHASTHMHHRHSLGQQRHSALGQHTLTNGDALLAAQVRDKPVSPALRCVIALTIFFFLSYLTVVMVRIARNCAARAAATRTGTRRSSTGSSNTVAMLVTCEGALTQANDALAHVPMLCILFVAARLRAMQLNPAVGDPPRWLQLSMYMGAGALFLRFLFDLIANFAAASASTWVIHRRVTFVARSMASITVYCVSGSIIVGIFFMKAPAGESTPDLPTTLWCVAALTGCYFLEYLILEVASAAMGSQAVQRARERHLKTGVEAVPLQFPPMLCVLLVGMTMRMVQMSLELPHWAYCSVVLSTLVVILQAASAVGNVLLITGLDEGKPLQEATGSQGQVAVVVQSVLLGCLCISAGLTLFSCFSMEQSVMTQVWWPQAADRHDDGVPPLSTTMRCVLALTAMYFLVKLPLLACGMACGGLKKRASNMMSSVQNSLVFAPMLCVMMIGVRLRAMQLKIRDPQVWAQTAMAAATGAVICKVVCSLLRETSMAVFQRGEATPGSIDDPDCAAGVGTMEPIVEQSVISKVVTIVLLAFHYVASVVLYVAVLVLIVALLIMQSPA
eukprot:TRINITY_DN80544_c0_g1_i1.p1 TRINITY_DN80544_c0_g1~~TRINITY_DN80544_c0_g1_i1.p1  ORF type:complete len:567 (+),score=119.65 TRINITY_DN80544_c0_g1_i1:189-1889(+)